MSKRVLTLDSSWMDLMKACCASAKLPISAVVDSVNATYTESRADNNNYYRIVCHLCSLLQLPKHSSECGPSGLGRSLS